MQDPLEMQCMCESCKWNWDKHCAKFHQQVSVIEELAIARMVTNMSNKDQISAFLKTILKDCNNMELMITKGIIEGDRSRFITLFGNVIPHLMLSIDKNNCCAAVAKCTITNTNTESQPNSWQRNPQK